MARFRLTPRARQAAWSLALAVAVATLSVVTIELSRWHPHPEPSLKSRATALSARDASTPSLAHDQRLVALSPERAASAPRQGAASLREPAVPSASEPSASPESKFKSARELFADANQARVRGDAPLALAISQQLEVTFPNSSEGITTHLSLGVLYLQLGDPSRALQEFKIYRHIGASEMMAEALWGQEQAYQKLGRTREERAVLEELLQNYPHSAYVAAAEQRLAALNN